MGSIATTKGDAGQTGLAGGIRVSKASVRVDAYGGVDDKEILAYLNRLSDLLWLFARKLEHDAGINSSLREQTSKEGNRWSRAW